NELLMLAQAAGNIASTKWAQLVEIIERHRVVLDNLPEPLTRHRRINALRKRCSILAAVETPGATGGLHQLQLGQSACVVLRKTTQPIHEVALGRILGRRVER